MHPERDDLDPEPAPEPDGADRRAGRSRRRPRRWVLAVVVVALAVVAGGIGLAGAGDEPEPGEAFPFPGAGAAADAAAEAAANGRVPVYDRAVGKTIYLDAAVVEAEKAAAAQAPGYLDADGNPRYIVVWEHGKLVPGPALECTPSDGAGEPANCVLAE